MAIVYVTQLPHRRDPVTRSLVPAFNIMPATEHGTLKILMPPQAAFVHTDALVRQLRGLLANFDPGADYLLTAGDPIITAAAIAILAQRGPFAVLRWDKNVGRYHPALITV